MQEVLDRSPGCEDPLEKEMANHSSILAWEISWTEDPGRLQSTGLQRAGHSVATKQINKPELTIQAFSWMFQAFQQTPMFKNVYIRKILPW